MAVCKSALEVINSPEVCLGDRDIVFPVSVGHIIHIVMTIECFENAPKKPVFPQNARL